MRKINLFNSTMLIGALLLLAGCNLVELDEPGPTAPVDIPEGLPATAAEITTALAGDDSRLWTTLTFELEGMAGFQSCRLDDTFIFFVDGTYRYDGGAVLCGGADDQRIKTGTWELDFDNSQLIFDRGTSKAYNSDITALEDNSMQLNGEVDIFGQIMEIEGVYETNAN